MCGLAARVMECAAGGRPYSGCEPSFAGAGMAGREVRVGCDAGSTGQPGAIRPVKQALLGAALKRPGPARRTRIDPAVAAEALGLTEMESRVAVLLAEGMTVRDVAAAMGRGESTIRSHVKHMFAKHGLSRQADLVRLVLALGGAPESRH